jgi:hypothetical protein
MARDPGVELLIAVVVSATITSAPRAASIAICGTSAKCRGNLGHMHSIASPPFSLIAAIMHCQMRGSIASSVMTSSLSPGCTDRTGI